MAGQAGAGADTGGGNRHADFVSFQYMPDGHDPGGDACGGGLDGFCDPDDVSDGGGADGSAGADAGGVADPDPDVGVVT